MPLVLSQKQVGEIRCSETVAPTLTGQANASARNHPLVLAVHENQRAEVRLSDKMNSITNPGGKPGQGNPVILQDAFRISSDASNVMRSSNPYTGIKKADIRPTLDTVDPSPSKAQGGIAIVTTGSNQHLMTTETYCLAENTIGRQPHNGGNGNGFQKDLSYTLNATGVHGVKTEARVRKLTPIECERLQGFTDNYTRIPWKGKSAEECPDSPRYKAIGNSWCVPCVRWIGERIKKELEK